MRAKRILSKFLFGHGGLGSVTIECDFDLSLNGAIVESRNPKEWSKVILRNV